MVYAITKHLVWPVLRLFIKKIDGIENLPKGPCIIVANHTSYIDGVLLLLMEAWHRNNKLYTFATDTKFNNWFWKPILEHYGAIRIGKALQKGLAVLKNNPIAIFPEGTRTYDGKIQPVKHTGLGVLALKSKKLVVPVHIDTWRWWNRYQKLPNFKRNITITIGKPLKFRLRPTTQNYKKVVKETMNEVKKLARTPHN